MRPPLGGASGADTRRLRDLPFFARPPAPGRASRFFADADADTARLLERVRVLQQRGSSSSPDAAVAPHAAASAAANDVAAAASAPAPLSTAASAEVCAICLGGVRDAASLDSCAHLFCTPCARAWLAVSSTCPLCKAPVAVLTRRRDGSATAVAPKRQAPHWDGGFGGEGDSGSDDDDDGRDAACAVCGSADDAGTLLLCDGTTPAAAGGGGEAACRGAAHARCAGLPCVPPGDWFCTDCLTAKGGGGGSAWRAAARRRGGRTLGDG